ncbi:MAG: hypothetical protein AAFX02_02515 [Pseudomonadota bacterium]
MTERGETQVSRSSHIYKIASSQIEQTGDKLIFDINETSVPLPRALRGRVTVDMPYCHDHTYDLSEAGGHIWRPICPTARVNVEFDQPGLNWSGHGYVDMNLGDGPIEQAFDFWDWSRQPIADDGTRIRYVTNPAGEEERSLGVEFGSDGSVREVDLEPGCPLPSTPIWRIKRRSGLFEGEAPKIVKTLEDTPFYSRSIMSYPSAPERLAVHESLSGPRLAHPVVKCLLPFRMPRWPL